MIDVRAHKDLIESLFGKYGLLPSCYELVPDVQAWCVQHGIEESNPFRAAKCLCRREDGAFHIVFREVQTDEMIDSANIGMAGSGLAFCARRQNARPDPI